MAEIKQEPKTVHDWLEDLQRGIIALAHCCNRDGQYNEANKLQGMLVQLASIDIQCSDVAAWPPKVDVDSSGDSAWVCVDG